MITRFKLASVAVAAGLLIAASAEAHHSFAMFDRNTEIVKSGTVVRWAFNNPHSWLYLNVRNPDGTQTLWSFEGASPTGLIQRGITGDTFKPGANVTFTAGSLPPVGALVAGAHRGLLRIAQEALSNVARHARASTVNIALERKGDALTLTVTDDGAGFAGAGTTVGMGLSNIRARAAEFGGEAHIGSVAGEGTTVFVALPLTVANPEYYRRRVLWTAAAAAGLVLLFFERWRVGRGQMMAIMLVPMIVNGTRYFVAWRRARRLREAGA